MKKLAFLFLLSFLFFSACRRSAGREPAPAGAGRLVSTDEVAARLIGKDPSLLLVDVRPAVQFDSAALPGAINIPIADILNEDQQARLDCGRYEVVFYAEDDADAIQAVTLMRGRGCDRAYAMGGGLRGWTASILQVQEPPQTASAEEWDRYRFHSAARIYFTGGSVALKPEPYVQSVSQKQVPKKIPLKARKKEAKEEEGC